MTQRLARKRIRLAVNTEDFGNVKDQLTGENPAIWHGTDTQLELGIFFGSEAVLLDNIASLKVEVMAEARDAVPLILKTVARADFNLTMTVDQWNAKTDQHVIVPLTSAETGQVGLQPDTNQKTKKFWLVVSVLTTDSPTLEFTLAGTELTVHRGGTGGTYEDPDPIESFYTRAESDARYMPIAGVIADIEAALSAYLQRDEAGDLWAVKNGTRVTKLT